MKQNPELFRKNMELLRDAHGYPNLRPAETEDKSPDQIARAAIDHAKSNLKALYNHTPRELRDQAHEWYEGAHNMAAAAAQKYDLPVPSTAGVFAALSPQKGWDQNIYLAERVIEINHTQQNTRWSDDMTIRAGQIWKPKDLPCIREIFGKTLGELAHPVEKAMWIRTYDEAYSDRHYQHYSPDGRPLGLARTAAGEPAEAAWQSVPSIANAVRALDSNGDRDQISLAMGSMHKVRSFYNNILDPHSPNADVTMDTHAVGAALLRPLSGADTAVMHSLGTSPQSAAAAPPGWKGASKSDPLGVKGTYALWADAYREAAAELGIEPRVLQSATWEAKRQLFGNLSNRTSAAIEAAWREYHDGNRDLAATQSHVLALAERDQAERAARRGNA
jgi:hypothetical protein